MRQMSSCCFWVRKYPETTVCCLNICLSYSSFDLKYKFHEYTGRILNFTILFQHLTNYTIQAGFTAHSESIQTPWLFPHFVTLQPYSKCIKYFFSLINRHTIPHNDKAKTGLYIKANVDCYANLNWAQVHPVSIDHPWDVSITWLEFTCVKFNWLDMIWKGTHLSI